MKKLAAALVSAVVFFVPLVSSAAINTLNGLSTTTQTFATSTAPNSMHLLIISSGSVHTFKWDGTPWLLNQGGTGATSFATGSIPFINNGVFSQNNTQLFWDAANTILNIGGATTTTAKVNIRGSGTLSLLNLGSASTSGLFVVSNTGSTTIANGINITAGCYAKNGVCISTGSGSVESSTQGYIAYYPLNGSSVAGTSTIFFSPSGMVGINNTNPFTALDINGAYYSRLITSGSGIDWGIGNVQTLTLTSSPTLVFSNAQAGGKYDIILTQDSTGGRTVTWPASVKWPGGIAPTLSVDPDAIDSVSFIYNGTDYLGTYSLNYTTP